MLVPLFGLQLLLTIYRPDVSMQAERQLEYVIFAIGNSQVRLPRSRHITSERCVKTLQVKVAQTRVPSVEVPDLIPVLGSQPAGDVSYKPGGRLPLFSARPAVTLATMRGLLPVSLVGEQRHDGREPFAKDCYPTASRLRFEPGPFCA